MFIQKFIFVINYFIPCFIFGMYHELSHWIVAFVFYWFGKNSYPKIKITRIANMSINLESNGVNINSWYMRVVYKSSYKDKNTDFRNIIITIAPVFTIIPLFIFSPWWLCLLYIAYFDELFLSTGDIITIKDYLKKKK